MGFFDSMAERIANYLGKSIQSYTQTQAYRDYQAKGRSYSVESEISEALADLMLLFSSAPISGDNERAKWLDSLSDDFFNTKAKLTVSTGFVSGDCLVVPSWNGRNVQNIIADANNFEILEAQGDEITACAYVVDTAIKGYDEYKLLQAIELVPYTTVAGEKTYANRYRMFVMKNNGISTAGLSAFPQWANYDSEWYIPNVDRLLVGRFKSATINPSDPNALKGAPICFGASDHINEIHYLLHQMHEEFGLSEKVIIADKRLFQTKWNGDNLYHELPKGRERLFVDVQGNTNDMILKEWAPDIRYQAYLEALDKQEKLVERAVGVSGGIISSSNDMNYQNVDNVRKSQQKTMSFISTARRQAESCITNLVYAWDRLANYYEINPVGEYDINFDWSNEFVETFADRQNAILAGEAIGATDAVDYRMFVMEESPETARERVAEIKANKAANALSLEVE